MKKKSGKRHQRISPIPLDPLCEIDGQRFLSSQSRLFPHRFGTGYGWSIRAGETDEHTANILGWLNEGTSVLSPFGSTNMDLWNNSVGRKLGSKAKTREQLADLVGQALKSGELIIRLDDPRKFTESVPQKPSGDHSVIVLRKDTKGVNEHFYNFDSSKVLSRAEFVAKIQADHYPGYGIRNVRGVDYPFSKRDSDPLNNLG